MQVLAAPGHRPCVPGAAVGVEPFNRKYALALEATQARAHASMAI